MSIQNEQTLCLNESEFLNFGSVEFTDIPNDAVFTFEGCENEPKADLQPKTEVQPQAEVQPQLEPQPTDHTPTIDHSQIQSLDYLGNKIRYATLTDGMAVVCAYDLFSCLFSGASVYPHIIEIEKGGIDAIELCGTKVTHKDKFFTLKKVNERILSYSLPKSKYAEKPQTYAAFVEFITLGGINLLAEKMGVEANFKAKDLDYLGIEKQGEIQPEKSIEQQVPPQPTNKALDAVLQRLEAMQMDSTLQKQDSELFQNKVIEAIETLKENSEKNDAVLDQNQKGFAKEVSDAIQALAKQQAENIEAQKQALQMQKEALQADIERTKFDAQQALQEIQAQAIAQIQDDNGIDPIRAKFTNSKIWLRIAIAVTLIFLPFTFLGLHKYIAIETENWFASFGVGFLCFLIALVWDGAIFLFTINGKIGLARFGSFVQFVFFSAKFDFIKMVVNDLGHDGDYWQKMAVVLCAVIYSPLLLSQIADLSSQKTKEENATE